MEEIALLLYKQKQIENYRNIQKGQKRKKTDKNGQKLTKNIQERTERDSKGHKEPETDRNGQKGQSYKKQTETERRENKETETNRNRQKWTETSKFSQV